MNTKRITAVTFDFWNTLFVEVAPGIAQRRAELMVELLAQADVRIRVADTKLALDDAWRVHRDKWCAGIRFNNRDAAKQVASSLGCGDGHETLDTIQSVLEYMYPPRELTPCDALEPMLGTLTASGLRIGIVCDTGFTPGRTLWESLAKLDLTKFFNGSSFSDEVGAFKPDRRIFEHSLTYLGSHPETTVHVGDLWYNDVFGAKAVGFWTVRYRGWNDDRGKEPEADYVSDNHKQTVEWILERA
jgi:putative hydrolase of the HAD superfamily